MIVDLDDLVLRPVHLLACVLPLLTLLDLGLNPQEHPQTKKRSKNNSVWIETCPNNTGAWFESQPEVNFDLSRCGCIKGGFELDMSHNAICFDYKIVPAAIYWGFKTSN